MIFTFALLSLPRLPEGVQSLSAEQCLSLASPRARSWFLVTPALEKEVVLLPVTIDTVGAKALGVALRADVTHDGERWRISRSITQRREVQGEDLSWTRSRAKAVVVGIEALTARYPNSPSGGFRETYRSAKADFAAGRGGQWDFSVERAAPTQPTARLLAAILRALPDAALAQAAPGSTTAYSNAPIGLECPLSVPPGAMEAYVAAQTRFAEWAQTAGQAQVDEPDRQFLPRGAPRPGERTCILSVIRDAGETAFFLQVFDREGACESAVRLAPSDFPVPTTTPAKETKLGIAALSPETLREMSEATPGAPGFRPSALDPDQRDPLDREAREALLRYARAKGYGRVVACVPDGTLRIVRSCLREGQVDLNALGRALPPLGVEEVPMGGTLVLRPAHPLLEEAMRVDRRPLAAEYRAASQGRFNLDALLKLHADYADAWDARWLLAAEETIFRDAFHLADSPNWNLPHPVLAALGSLQPDERQRLAMGTPVRIDPTSHLGVCHVLIAYASTQASTQRGFREQGVVLSQSIMVEETATLPALAKAPNRILAGSKGIVLTGRSATKTLVKRVSRGKATIHTYNPTTQEMTEQTGENLVMDQEFGPLANDFAFKMNLSADRIYSMLDRRYRFLWSEEPQIAVFVDVANACRIGPVVLREPPLRQSKGAVPLAEVPGVEYRPKGP